MDSPQETKGNNECSKCKINEELSDIKIANQDLGKLCKAHFAEFQKKIIEHFKTWTTAKA